MTPIEFITEYWKTGLLWLIIGSGLIQISPIKINPWSWIIRKIGQIANEELITKVDKLQSDLDKALKDREQHYAEDSRRRIVEYAGNLSFNEYSRERYTLILQDIDFYEHFAVTHPDFPNSQAVASIKYIRQRYEECLKNNSFLEKKIDK